MTQRDLWNGRYSQKGTVWGAEPNQFVADRTKGMTPRRVLDLGSGQGRNAIYLAQQGHQVVAVDISDVATAQARELALEVGVDVDFIAADLESWESPEAAFDLVVLAYMQAPAVIRKWIHAEAARALVDGGQVLVVGHHLDNLEHGVGGPPIAEVLFDERDLAGDFADFDVIENSRVLRQVDKGDVVGDAIDIVFVGTKRAGTGTP